MCCLCNYIYVGPNSFSQKYFVYFLNLGVIPVYTAGTVNRLNGFLLVRLVEWCLASPSTSGSLVQIPSRHYVDWVFSFYLTVGVFPGIIFLGVPPTSKTRISSLSSLFSFVSNKSIDNIQLPPKQRSWQPPTLGLDSSVSRALEHYSGGRRFKSSSWSKFVFVQPEIVYFVTERCLCFSRNSD